MCRLFEQRPTSGTLLPYEAKMLDLVRDRAVDDGRSDELRAYRFHRGELRERDIVRLTVSPHLRHVYDCVVIGHSGRSISGPSV